MEESGGEAVVFRPKRYLRNILIAIDQLIGALFGGDPDETISSAAGKRNGKVWWATLLCKVLNWLDTGHCKKSIEKDEGGNSAWL